MYKTIWRIENEKGEGLYKGSWDWQEETHSVESGRPAPWNESIKKENKSVLLSYVLRSEHFFGFISLDQLTNWFSEKEIRNLYSEGFQIVRFDRVPDVIASKTQAIFERDREPDFKISGEGDVIENLLSAWEQEIYKQ